MAEYIQGWKDVYGKIHPTKEAAALVELDFVRHQEMYRLIGEQIPIVGMASYQEVAEYIIRYFNEIDKVMKKYG